MNVVLKSLKKRRLELKLKQSELGSKLGLPQSHISKIERGETDPRLSTVTDMARLLDMEIVLAPREMLPIVKAILNNEDTQRPKWSLDGGDEE